MTQQNAALGQETNAKIEQTERQTNELDTLVEVFILAEVPGKLRPRSSSHRRLDRDDRRRRGGLRRTDFQAAADGLRAPRRPMQWR